MDYKEWFDKMCEIHEREIDKLCEIRFRPGGGSKFGTSVSSRRGQRLQIAGAEISLF